jgi:diacylglycerol kinase
VTPDAGSRHAARQAARAPGDAASVLAHERASFSFAAQGLRYGWRTQRHLRIHAAVAAIVVGAGLLLSLSPAEWAALIATIVLVTALELLNTVVEVVVDLITLDYHPQAKIAKDVAAGAVLVAAIGAVLVGGAIFLPRLWLLVRQW